MSVRMESKEGTSRAAEPKPHLYDVFINYRGPDVNTFVSHLHAGLSAAGLQPFLHANPDFELYWDIDKLITEALNGASVLMAIFSKRYAESRHCLNELCDMLKTGKDILPVYYHVDPVDLRRIQNGPFREGFRKHFNQETEEQILKWKDALRKISCYRGLRLDEVNGNEAELVRRVLQEVGRLMPNVLPVPMVPMSKPKFSTDSGGSPGGLSRKCPDMCPECGKSFRASQSMLFHLMDHWTNQKFSPPPQSSRDSGGDSWFSGMDSRWWLMYKGVRYLEVDAPRVVVTHNSKEVISEVDEWEVHDKWAAQIWLLHGNEISLGLYPTMLEAAYAYDVAFTCLGGESMLNFHRHPIYEQIPRNFPYLPLEVLVAKLTKVVKEFGKLAMEGGYYGTIEQEMTLMDFLDMSSVKKSAHDESMFLNSNAQQAGDLNNFQENKRLSFSNISDGSDGDLQDWINSCLLDNEKLLALVSNAYENVSETLPLYPNISALNISDPWPTIELANTRNKQPHHLVSPSHDMLLRSPDGALKFTMADLNIISGNFSESLTVGQGDSGSVYRGQFKDGTMVAVKRIKKIIQASDQNDKNVLEIEDTKDLQTRIGILSKEEHSNLVRLLGFLEDENEQILVTEYVTNGNLRQHLDGVPYKVILDMSKRCRISLDVVAALKHLHNQTNDDLDIIYRDFKSSDVLITNDFHAKVAGFGLLQHSAFGDVGASSSNTQVKKTSGYMACEHSIAHHLKEKNDVYSFGELLVEIFTGKRLIESNLPSDECFTPRWVLKKCAEGRLTDIIDPKITPTTFDLKILEQIFKLAASCLVLEESSRPTVEDVFRDLSFIVGHYFGDLKHQSNFEEDKYKIQNEQKWDHEACITPNSQTLCLEESEALRRQEPTKHLDKIDSSSPSFMPIELDGSLFVEGSKSNKDRTCTQLGTQLEVDSTQVASQAFDQLVTKQDSTSPLFIDIIPDVFQLKPDERYFEMLQEEITKLGYISRLLSSSDEFEQNQTNIGKTSFFLYFNKKDDVFEFYFKNYQGMASIVGVGLECAKVLLEDGWRVIVQEISKPNWDDSWKNFDSSSSAMKVTISEPLEEGDMEDPPEPVASIPRGQCLLLDLAQYFVLEKAIASFLSRASTTHANTDSSTSSSSSSQDIARSSSSGDQKSSRFLQAMKNIFISQEVNQLKTRNGDGPPINPLGNDDAKIDTTVHLKLLPGGCLFDGNTPFNATISDDKELKTLTSQLDNTIYLEMMFKFLNEDGSKEIQVIVGPISFQFQVENEINYKTTGRYGWYHKLLDVSFRPVNTCDAEIGHNYSALDIVKVKKTITIGSSDSTTRGASKSMNGRIQGKIPHTITLSGGVNSGWSTTKCVSDNVDYAIEKEFEETRGGFAVFPERNLHSSTLKYTYCEPDYMHELDHEKLPHEDYRKFVLNPHPICIPQDVKFEGTWHPKDLESNPQAVVEYSLYTSREVHMTSKELSKKVEKKSWITMICGHPKIQKESNEPLKYTQKYARSIFLNHAMTHLNGKKFKVEEILSQRPLNEREPETHFNVHSSFAPLWHISPLVGLNSELHHQP